MSEMEIESVLQSQPLVSWGMVGLRRHYLLAAVQRCAEIPLRLLAARYGVSVGRIRQDIARLRLEGHPVRLRKARVCIGKSDGAAGEDRAGDPEIAVSRQRGREESRP